MKVLNQMYKVWGECPTDLEDMILWIERAGRICYKSQDKIVEGSGGTFVNNIVKRGHWSVLEHSNVVLRAGHCDFNSKFLTRSPVGKSTFVGGNLRAWMEQRDVFTLDGFFTSGLYKQTAVKDNTNIPLDLKRVTVELLTDRAVLAEITRHRDDCAFSVESQRYCSYKDELEVILPWHYKDVHSGEIWAMAMQSAERAYKSLLEAGESPEKARSVLPNSTAVHMVVTANLKEWQHIFKLRCSKRAYPQIRELLTGVQDEFINRGWNT